MVKRYLVILAALVLAACSNPKDLKFGDDPPADMQKNSEALKKLEPQDLILLNSYVVVHGEALRKRGKPHPAIGKTVGEALADAKVWQEANSAAAVAERTREEVAKKEAAKAEAKRKFMQDKIAAILNISFVKRTITPANPDAKPSDPVVQLEYDIKNTAGKPLLALKGKGIYKDASGKTIVEHPFQYDKTIAAGGQAHVTYTYPASSQFEEMKSFAGVEDGKFSFAFVLEALILEGGETITYESLGG